MSNSRVARRYSPPENGPPCEQGNPLAASIFPALWDTIGTLAAIVIEIIALLPLFESHGGAPRGERPALWDARCLASAWSAAS
jgi:hypothetical protein